MEIAPGDREYISLFYHLREYYFQDILLFLKEVTHDFGLNVSNAETRIKTENCEILGVIIFFVDFCEF